MVALRLHGSVHNHRAVNGWTDRPAPPWVRYLWSAWQSLVPYDTPKVRGGGGYALGSDRSCLPSGMTYGYEEAHGSGVCTSQGLESVQLKVIHASIFASFVRRKFEN